MDNMDNTNYVNVNPLPDEVGGVNCETKTGNTEEIREPAVNVEGNEASDTSTESVSDEEAASKAQELMRLISDPKVLRAYQDIRSDFYGKRKRNQVRQVSKKDAKKKKTKRRMAKKSKRS